MKMHLLINCFNTFNSEFFNNTSENTTNNQLESIAQQYGDNYLKTNGNIPISFLHHHFLLLYKYHFSISILENMYIFI